MKNFLFIFAILFFTNCNAQQVASQNTPIEFEDVYHYPYALTSEKFLFIKDQQKMDAVYSVIHKKTGGNRMAPIPTVNDDEIYLIFKPILKTSNDVEIKKIYLKNTTLYVQVQPFTNPELQKNSRITPNILVKLLKKVSAKKVVITYQ